MISSLLAALAVFGVMDPERHAITPLYIECLMYVVDETGQWSDECEQEMRRRMSPHREPGPVTS
jgi:hypothetical protein